jgi:lipopolysaccharide export system permease protein
MGRTFSAYLRSQIYAATLFVFVAFLGLFAFFDLIGELGELGQGNYRMPHVAAYVALLLPGHIYELFPIVVLIGTLYALAHMAASSEYTVMRGAGLSPQQAAKTLARIGMTFVILTFIVGEFVAPVAEKAAQRLKLSATSGAVVQDFRTGLWVKDDRRFVNVREVRPDTSLADVRIYEFDARHRLLSISQAAGGRYVDDNLWRLTDVVQTRFGASSASVQRFEQLDWQSVLTPDILSVLFVLPERMSAWNLFQYSRHLGDNNQNAERYDIAFWKKLLYPFATLVMMGLALPFAYIHSRAGGVGAKVFSGIMLGVLFHLLNSLFSHIGLLNHWSPLLSALSPSLLFVSAAVLMMTWVERR